MTIERVLKSSVHDTERQVWYASYGSNLLRARFDCYLKGTQFAGQRYGCNGARNPTDPCEVISLDVPHRLFFARESPRWGGGIAFLDPTPSQGDRARLRLYKITLEQFNDVLAQENRLPIPLTDDVCVTDKRLDELSLVSGISLLNSPYGYLTCLGHRDGCPVLTFTCAPQDSQRAKEGLAPWQYNLPSQAYFNVIKSGLTESGMTPDAAHEYMFLSLKPAAVSRAKPAWERLFHRRSKSSTATL